MWTAFIIFSAIIVLALAVGLAVWAMSWQDDWSTHRFRGTESDRY